MKLPNFITHYYETDYGPFLNICDLDDEQIEVLTSIEKDANTAFNRFAIGPDFFRWRRAADDLLIRAYTEKFGFPPPARPFYALLGSFDKTLTMFRNGSPVRLETKDFEDHELTFMYPDHAHLISHYGSDAPPLFYQPHPDLKHLKFWGRLFTYAELLSEYSELGIDSMVELHESRNGWAGCYVEAHIWCRDHRTTLRGQGGGGTSGALRTSPQTLC
jgi:hypothetical protein